jgi:hypothetical protein
MREEFGDPSDGMRGNTGEHVSQPDERIDAIPLTRCRNAAKNHWRATAVVTAKEDPIVLIM